MMTPFREIHVAGTHIVLEADFPLPYDGTPGSSNALVIHIEQEHEGQATALLRVLSRTHGGAKVLAQSEVTVSFLGNLLYGAARVRNMPVLELTVPRVSR